MEGLGYAESQDPEGPMLVRMAIGCGDESAGPWGPNIQTGYDARVPGGMVGSMLAVTGLPMHSPTMVAVSSASTL